MAQSRISVPASFGGLLRYDEEVPSKFILKPQHVIAFVIFVIIINIILRIIFPLK